MGGSGSGEGEALVDRGEEGTGGRRGGSGE